MLTTDLNFVISNHRSIKEILSKYNIRQCMIACITNIGLQMLLDTDNPKDFYKVEDELTELALNQKRIFTIKFCSMYINGEPMFGTEDSIDFDCLVKPNKSLRDSHKLS